MGRYFRAHFPKVGAQIDEWNAIEYYPRSQRFHDAMNEEATHLGLTNQGWAVLATLAEGYLKIGDLTWSVENEQIVVRSLANFWVVQEHPQGTAFEDIRREVTEFVPTLLKLPAVREFNAAKEQIERQRAALVDALETIEAKADPGGHCPGCPS
jgi:hypothetical protein